MEDDDKYSRQKRYYDRNKENEDFRQRRKAALAKTRAKNPRDKEKERLIKQEERGRQDRIKEYEMKIRYGPEHVCSSCKNLFFIDSMKKISAIHLDPTIANWLKVGNSVCCSCYRHIQKEKVPPMFFKNGHEFNLVPQSILDLNTLEERMVSLYIPFMNITSSFCSKPCDRGQKKLRGNVINVPLCLDSTISILPRNPQDCNFMVVHLKRQLRGKTNYLAQTVNPQKVITALKLLITQPLYKDVELKEDNSWLFQVDNEEIDGEEQNTFDLNGNFSGTHDTMIISDSEYLGWAPCENKTPVNQLLEKSVEEKCFPSLFGGCPRKISSFETTNKFSMSKIVKNELRHEDRRFASNAQNVFFKFKTVLLERLYSRTQIMLRKINCPTDVRVVDVTGQNIQSMINRDQAFQLMNNIPSSPAYWERVKKNLRAMIRQLGKPTMFLTIGPSEHTWEELSVILERVVNKKEISEEAARNMSYVEKDYLIRTDPVTVARYVDHRFRCLMKVVLSESGPFKDNPVVDYFYRVEFQQRGSAHLHILLWLEGSPIYDPENLSSVSDVTHFIDKYITCSTDTFADKHQRHNHTFTCYKTKGSKKDKTCRFGLPEFLMNETIVLEPLPPVTPRYSEYRKTAIAIKSFLVQGDGTVQTADDLASQFNLSYEEYVKVVRCYIKRSTVFLKRNFEERNINGHNKLILSLNRANIDLQFILNPYAVCSYVVDYISKSQRGMSTLLREIERQREDIPLKKLRQLSHALLGSQEISIQECVWQLLSMKFTNCSRSTLYINSNPPHERCQLLKPLKQLKGLKSDSTDIYIPNIFDHYSKRPACLEDVSLAEFAASYTSHNFDESDVDEDCVARMRKKHKVIRYRGYKEDVDRSEYCRESVLLFMPWRNENSDVNQDPISKFQANKQIIINERKRFNVLNNIDDIMLDYEIEDEEDNSNDGYVFHISEEQCKSLARELISNECGEKDHQKMQMPSLLPEDQYSSLIATLNEKQRTYLYGISKISREFDHKPFYHFVSGSAGVGKSVLIRAIFQTLTRECNRKTCRTDTNKVILTAYTGKAAFNINGMTLHSAFSLPVTTNRNQLSELSSSVANTLTCDLIDCKYLICDEVSMIGSRTFSNISRRLQQVKKNNLPFGGLSVIVLGDFQQLPPVMDSYIFSKDRDDPFTALTGNSLWDLFEMYELTQIMRQADDKEFAEALTRFSFNQSTEEDLRYFNSRQIQAPTNLDCIHLYFTNVDVDNHNSLCLSSLQTETAEFQAVDTINGAKTPAEKQKILDWVQQQPRSITQGLANLVTIKVDARYMLTCNIDTSDGLTNGAIGTLKEISYGYRIDKATSNRIRLPSTLWLLFDDKKTGQKARLGNSQLTPIKVTKKVFQYKNNKSIHITRNQFPVVPAFALTFHKSQGMTYDNVAVHITKGVSRNCLYVGMSRARCISGLFIFGTVTRMKDKLTNIIIDSEITRLRSRPLIFPNLHEAEILIHNIQSFKKHSYETFLDPVYKNCEMLAFVETWLSVDEPAAYPDKILLARLEMESSKGKGIIIFASPCFAENVMKVQTIVESKRSLIEGIRIDSRDTCYLIVYATKPSYPQEIFEFCKQVQDNSNLQKFVVGGDFNLDLLDLKHDFICTMEKIGLRNQINAKTTNYGTQLDSVFSNFDLKCTTYENLTSYHRPLLVKTRNIDN